MGDLLTFKKKDPAVDGVVRDALSEATEAYEDWMDKMIALEMARMDEEMKEDE